MEARFFRYQYEYTQDGIIQSGCVWNTGSGEKTTYLYMAGEYTPTSNLMRREGGGVNNLLWDGSALNIFVLSAYTIPYIRKLVDILDEREIRTVILPYAPPVVRLDLITHLVLEGGCTEELQKFLEAPYAYLKENHVENVYLLYGNGSILKEETASLEEGHYFEKTDKRLQAMINDLEGGFVPVYYAGYIVENQWFYYFGFYNVDALWSGLGLTLDTITMFVGPVHAENEEVSCILTARDHAGERCYNNIEEKDQYENCLLKCIYRNDYDVLNEHMDRNHEVLRAGLLNLGNVNLNTDLKQIITRYGIVLEQVRGISVPNCGNEKFWNKKLLSIISNTDMKYFICACGENTGNGVIRDIVTAGSRNRFINVDDKSAYCFSGYIVPKDEN